MPIVTVRVPATSANLGPGFDTLGLALKIYNQVTVAEAPDGIDRAYSSGAGSQSLATDATNIALVAARRLFDSLGVAAVPLELRLDNAIPLARGLGSSAAARIGALVATNQWLARGGAPAAGKQHLLALATELEGHPDNAAAALLGGLTVSVGLDAASDKAAHGDRATGHPTAGDASAGPPPVLATRLPVQRFPRLLLFVPETELATSAARSVLPDAVFRVDANFNVARVALLLAALTNGEWEFLGEALRDRLHQEHRAVLMPALQAVLHAARNAGAYGATLSGAGPTILAWLPWDADVRDAVQSAMVEAAAEHEVFGKAVPVEVDLEGCVVLAE